MSIQGFEVPLEIQKVLGNEANQHISLRARQRIDYSCASSRVKMVGSRKTHLQRAPDYQLAFVAVSDFAFEKL